MIYTKKFENLLNSKITAMGRAMITMHHSPYTLHPTPRTSKNRKLLYDSKEE
jgi:hypothetical protein